MKPIPTDPMAAHSCFINALCADWLEAGTVVRSGPRSNAVLEIIRQRASIESQTHSQPKEATNG